MLCSPRIAILLQVSVISSPEADVLRERHFVRLGGAVVEELGGEEGLPDVDRRTLAAVLVEVNAADDLSLVGTARDRTDGFDETRLIHQVDEDGTLTTGRLGGTLGLRVAHGIFSFSISR